MKGLTLISAGIDSPVATWIMQQRGVEVIGIHFSNEPLAYKLPREKSIELCKKLGVKKVYVAPHGMLVQRELIKNCESSFRCVLCRRMMFRVAEKIALKEGCDFLITGENLGQVASQTIENMGVADSVVKIPVLRPLLCNDKQETVDLAIKIDTYELSVEASSCCNAVPKNPITKARLDRVNAEEEKIDVDELVRKCVDGCEVILL